MVIPELPWDLRLMILKWVQPSSMTTGIFSSLFTICSEMHYLQRLHGHEPPSYINLLVQVGPFVRGMVPVPEFYRQVRLSSQKLMLDSEEGRRRCPKTLPNAYGIFWYMIEVPKHLVMFKKRQLFSVLELLSTLLVDYALVLAIAERPADRKRRVERFTLAASKLSVDLETLEVRERRFMCRYVSLEMSVAGICDLVQERPSVSSRLNAQTRYADLRDGLYSKKIAMSIGRCNMSKQWYERYSSNYLLA